MCGIVGYVGHKKCKDILLSGLKTLEYRGYDSSGMALKSKNRVDIIRSVGKIESLEKKIKEINIEDSSMGIAHTRWATHGEPSIENAHPHKQGMVTIVHNGIIENANNIKDKLLKDNVIFNSDTDTEVATALINKYYDNDPLNAIEKAIKELKGSYAFLIMFDNDNKLYAVRKDSPLVIGIGDDSNYVASDIIALIKYTNKFIYLNELEIAVIDKDNIDIYKDKNKIDYKVEVSNMNNTSSDLCGYKHYMMKEIMEEPVLLEKMINTYLNNLELLPDLRKYKEIHIVGCGSASYAGMIAKNLFEEICHVKTLVECASEYRYKETFYDKDTLVILISQSGETADTVAAMRKANQDKIDTLAIVNVKTSTIARESKYKYFIEAGPEIAVATTKAYLLQVALLSLIAYKNSDLNKEIKEEFERTPKLLRNILNRIDEYQRIAKYISNTNNVFFLGRKIDYAMALEGSLKLKEISYIHSEAYMSGELKHGSIALISDKTPVFAIITSESIKDKTISNVIEVKSRNAKIITISNEDNLLESDYYIKIEKLSSYVTPLLVVPIFQLISYYVGVYKDCDIDKPRNLAKSVTVE